MVVADKAVVEDSNAVRQFLKLLLEDLIQQSGFIVLLGLEVRVTGIVEFVRDHASSVCYFGDDTGGTVAAVEIDLVDLDLSLTSASVEQ